MNIDYKNTKINGFHYVREIKDESGERGFYILINNYNKPEVDVYHFLRERMRRYGDSLNSIKRKAYDLCHLYDFMSIISITPELLTYDELIEFCGRYLRIINPKFRVNDPIERSMLREIPMLDEFKGDNVFILNSSKTIGLDEASIARILNTAKLYLIYLNEIKGRDVDYDKIFTVKKIVVDNDDKLLGHRYSSRKIIYSVKGILKAAGILNVNSNVCEPAELSCIFEKEEEEKFFVNLNANKNPSVKVLFYLIRKTGMRANEALALQIEEYRITDGDAFLTNMKSDLRCKDKKENLWEVNIVYRPDNPKDLQLKNKKSRCVQFIDTDQVFLNLYKQAIFYRSVIMRAKRKNHRFLFINRSGNRLRYSRAYQIFNEVLMQSNLIDRKGGLTIHSFRHTYASIWISKMKNRDADIELDQLSKMLGHSTSKITREIYIHFFKEDRINLLKKMEETKFQKEE